LCCCPNKDALGLTAVVTICEINPQAADCRSRLRRRNYEPGTLLEFDRRHSQQTICFAKFGCHGQHQIRLSYHYLGKPEQKSQISGSFEAFAFKLLGH